MIGVSEANTQPERNNKMTDFDAKITKLLEKQSTLVAKREPITEAIVKLSKQIKKLREQKEQEEMSKEMTKAQKIEYFLFEDGSVDGKRYEERRKFWEGKGLWQSGYFPELNQVNLKVMLHKGENDNLEQTIVTLEEVTPFLKLDKGVKRLDVFEHTLSENGSYSFEIDEKSFDLVVHRWHRKSTVKSFDSLRGLLEYVQEHHYYESSVDSDDEDFS